MSLSVVHLLGAFPVLYERAVLEEIAAARALGIRHAVVASNAAPDPLPPEFLPLARDVEFLDLGRRHGRALSAFLNLVAGMISGLRARDFAALRRPADVGRRARLRYILALDPPHLLHAHFGHLGLLALPVAESLNLPLVVSCRGQDVAILRSRPDRDRERLFAAAARILARSDFMRDELLRMGAAAGKVRTLPSGVNLQTLPFAERRHPGRPGRITLLAVGRLTPKKGLDVALRAFAQLPGAPLLRIIGDGPERLRLRALAADLRVADRVAFPGALPRAAVILEMLNAHLFLQPSRTAPDGDHEGVPNTLKEAQATGLPVVATRHAGIPECVDDGRSGFLVAENNPDELAKRLIRLLNAPELWAPLGRHGRRIIEERYDLHRLAPELVELYHDVTGRRPSQPLTGQVAVPGPSA